MPPFVHAAVPVGVVVFAADLGVEMLERGVWTDAKDFSLLCPSPQLVVDEKMLEAWIKKIAAGGDGRAVNQSDRVVIVLPVGHGAAYDLLLRVG